MKANNTNPCLPRVFHHMTPKEVIALELSSGAAVQTAMIAAATLALPGATSVDIPRSDRTACRRGRSRFAKCARALALGSDRGRFPANGHECILATP